MCMIASPKTSSIIHSLHVLSINLRPAFWGQTSALHNAFMKVEIKIGFWTTWMKNHLKIPLLSVIGRFPSRSIKVMHSHNHKHCIWPDACMHGSSIRSWLQHLLKKEVLCNCNYFNRRLLTWASARSSSKVSRFPDWELDHSLPCKGKEKWDKLI